jgi:hypothetical protein
VFEKISRAAEKLATSVGESRRGFLARVGRAALGVAGVFVGLLGLPREAHAILVISACEVVPTYGGGFMTGTCVCNNPCRSRYAGSQCRAGAFVRSVGGGFLRICNTRVTLIHPCVC